MTGSEDDPPRDDAPSLADRVAAWTPPWARAEPTVAPADPVPSDAAVDHPGPAAEAPSSAADRADTQEPADDVERADDPEPAAADPEPDASEPLADAEPHSDAEPHGVEPLGDAEPRDGVEPRDPGPHQGVEAPEVLRSATDGDGEPADSSTDALPVSTGLLAGDAGADIAAGPAAKPARGAGAAGEARALPELDDPETLRAALEAILIVVDEPVSEVVLAQVLERPTATVAAAVRDLAESYTRQRRGFELRQAAGGWRIYTRDDFAPYVERFVLDGQQVRLTQAALETLAVVAYKQPVSRSRVSAIRGVNCDGVVRTLLTRGLIEECGAEPDSGAYLYRTTRLFLERMGINSTEELPDLAPFLPDELPEEAS